MLPVDPNFGSDGPLPYGSYCTLSGGGGEEEEGEFGPFKSTCLVMVSLDVEVGVGGTGGGDAVLDMNSNRPGGSIGVRDGGGGGGDVIASTAVRDVQNLIDSGFYTFQISDGEEEEYDDLNLDSDRNDSGSLGGIVDGGGGRTMKR